MSGTSMDITHLHGEYVANGYFVVRQLFDASELAPIRAVVRTFHECWQRDNADLYQTRAINSAYLTGTKYLQATKRLRLFNFIGSEKIAHAVRAAIPQQPMFINTQLFFNPVNADQKNYWHRDPQYHLTLDNNSAKSSRGRTWFTSAFRCWTSPASH